MNHRKYKKHTIYRHRTRITYFIIMTLFLLTGFKYPKSTRRFLHLRRNESHITIHWRCMKILKISKNVHEVIFSDIWKCIYLIKRKFIQYLIHWEKTQMLKKVPLDKIKSQIIHFFDFLKLQLITVVILIHNFYTSWSTRFISLKACLGFSIINFVLFSLKFSFLFNKKQEIFEFQPSWFLDNG